MALCWALEKSGCVEPGREAWLLLGRGEPHDYRSLDRGDNRTAGQGQRAHVTSFLKKRWMLELRAQPTKPWAAAGLCRKRISRGMSPSCKGRVCTISWRCQSHTYKWLPYSPAWEQGRRMGSDLGQEGMGNRWGPTLGRKLDMGWWDQDARTITALSTSYPFTQGAGVHMREVRGWRVGFGSRKRACAHAPADPWGPSHQPPRGRG